jgi:hypothetical protein
MAGEWIKMRADLHDDPAVFRLASMLGIDKYAVIGRLHTFWSWADRHSVDGFVDGAASTYVDEVVRLEGFAVSLVKVGWLEISDEGIRIPKFDRHNGDSAKQRALKNERQARWRAGKDVSVVDLVDAQASTSTSTREEKRREEKPSSPHAEKFGEFWSEFPRKDSKADALKAFVKLKVGDELFPLILAGLERAKESEQWTKDGGKFIPYAATWLNKRRWEDEESTLNVTPLFAKEKYL